MAFNFDEWALLAKHDRHAFEQKRAATLQHYITTHAKTADELRRLNGLQFKVDMLRRRHKTPLAACIALSELLMTHVYQLANLDLAITTQKSDKSNDPVKNATLLPFPKLKNKS